MAATLAATKPTYICSMQCIFLSSIHSGSTCQAGKNLEGPSLLHVLLSNSNSNSCFFRPRQEASNSMNNTLSCFLPNLIRHSDPCLHLLAFHVVFAAKLLCTNLIWTTNRDRLRHLLEKLCQHLTRVATWVASSLTNTPASKLTPEAEP
jgi:hypothetical protein